MTRRHRFFVPPEWIDKTKVTFSGQTAHQIKKVLRMKQGWQVEVLDNFGQEYVVMLTHVARSFIEGEILATRPVTGEPTVSLTLYQGTLKAQKFEWVLQKGTELGITEFVPVISERSVLADVEAVEQKMLRWESIVQEAAEQSGRGLLPELRPAMLFQTACQRAARMNAVRLLAWEEAEDGKPLRAALDAVSEKPAHVSIFIGSEGGYSEKEVSLAQTYGIEPVWAGKRILRAETAGIAIPTAVLYHFGEME